MATKTLTYILLGKDQLSPALKKAGKEAETTTGGIASAFGKISFAGIALAGVVGGTLVKALKDARSEGWSPLAVAAKDAGVSFDAFKPKAEAAGTAMAKLGFSQADVNASLKVLLTSTRNSQLSLNSLGGAADFARFKGIGLSAATAALAKAATGSTKALRDVGISTADLPKHFATTGTAADRMRIIMGLLSQRIGGQAVAASQTFGGKLQAMHAQLENVSAKIGTALLPILSALLSMVSTYILPAIQKFSDWFTNVGSPAISKFAAQLTPFVTTTLKGLFQGISDIINVFKGLPEPIRQAIVTAVAFVAGAALMVTAFKKMQEAVKAFALASKIAAASNPWLLLATAIAVIAVLIITHWNTVKAVALQVWGFINNYVTGVWHTIYNTTMAVVNSIVNVVRTGFDTVKNAVAVTLDWIKTHWPLLVAILTGPIGIAALIIIDHWNNIRNACAAAFNAVVSFFRALPGRILGAIGSVGTLLTGIGGQMISGLFRGITGALASVGNWVRTNIFQPIVGAIKSLFGIHSPSTVFAEMGGHMVSGLILGLLKSDPKAMIGKIFGSLPSALGALIGKGLVDIEHLPANALKALGGVAKSIGGFFAKLVGGGGGGVGQWMGTVLEALALNGLPSSLASQVLRQISSESGGNPDAINLTDSNAAAGDPSRGLLQTIGSTFSAYHIAGTSSNIFDPLANVAAAINYARHVYGPSLMSGGNGLGSGHGYALGTASASPGWHMIGERGPELMRFRGGERVIPNNKISGGNTVVNVYVKGALSTDRDIARAVSDGLAAHQRHGGNVPWK